MSDTILNLGERQKVQCYRSAVDPEGVTRSDIVYKLFVYRSFNNSTLPSQLIPRPCL